MARDSAAVQSAHAARLLEDPLLQQVLADMREACVEQIEAIADPSTEAAKAYMLERCRELRTVAAFRRDLEGKLLAADFERLNHGE